MSKLLAGVGVTLTPGPSAWLKGVLFSAAQGRGTFASPTQVGLGMGCAVQKHSLSAQHRHSEFPLHLRSLMQLALAALVPPARVSVSASADWADAKFCEPVPDPADPPSLRRLSAASLDPPGAAALYWSRCSRQIAARASPRRWRVRWACAPSRCESTGADPAASGARSPSRDTRPGDAAGLALCCDGGVSALKLRGVQLIIR